MSWDQPTETPEIPKNPIITILGRFKGGALIRCEWGSQQQQQLSDRTLEALVKLGVEVNDNPADYWIRGELI